MLYIKFNGGLICRISEDTIPVDEKFGGRENGWISARDAKTFAEAESWARYITAMTGKSFIGVDNGSHCSPRYEVLRAPAVGDKISYGFNGDYYPDGEIVKISPRFKVTSSTGSEYRRRGNTGGWFRGGGTWGLVQGHRDERNPSF